MIIFIRASRKSIYFPGTLKIVNIVLFYIFLIVILLHHIWIFFFPRSLSFAVLMISGIWQPKHRASWSSFNYWKPIYRSYCSELVALLAKFSLKTSRKTHRLCTLLKQTFWPDIVWGCTCFRFCRRIYIIELWKNKISFDRWIAMHPTFAIWRDQM